MYIDPCDIRRELLLYRETGRASDRLGAMLVVIADGVWHHQYRGFDRFGRSRDDDVSAATVKLLAVLPKVDPDRTPHSFLLTVASNVYRALRRDELAELRRLVDFAEDRLGLVPERDPRAAYIRSLPRRKPRR